MKTIYQAAILLAIGIGLVAFSFIMAHHDITSVRSSSAAIAGGGMDIGVEPKPGTVDVSISCDKQEYRGTTGAYAFCEVTGSTDSNAELVALFGKSSGGRIVDTWVNRSVTTEMTRSVDCVDETATDSKNGTEYVVKTTCKEEKYDVTEWKWIRLGTEKTLDSRLANYKTVAGPDTKNAALKRQYMLRLGWDEGTSGEFNFTADVGGKTGFLDPAWESVPQSGWTYYRNVTINNTATETLVKGYPINITVDTNTLIAAGKLRSDCSDLHIFWQGAADLDLQLANCNNAKTQVWFGLQENISASSKNTTDYRLNYGNASDTNPRRNYNNIYPPVYADTLIDYVFQNATDWAAGGQVLNRNASMGTANISGAATVATFNTTSHYWGNSSVTMVKSGQWLDLPALGAQTSWTVEMLATIGKSSGKTSALWDMRSGGNDNMLWFTDANLGTLRWMAESSNHCYGYINDTLIASDDVTGCDVTIGSLAPFYGKPVLIRWTGITQTATDQPIRIGGGSWNNNAANYGDITIHWFRFSGTMHNNTNSEWWMDPLPEGAVGPEGEATSAPVITLIAQTPADITTDNILAQNRSVNITYNVTSTLGILNDSVIFRHKTNTTNLERRYILNGTAYGGYETLRASNNFSTLWEYALRDSEVYPAVYNYNETYMETTPHSAYALNNNNQLAKIQLLNVSDNLNFSYFEIMIANVTPSALTARIYYCNETYVSGNPSVSGDCLLFYQLPAAQAYNHSHLESNHTVVPFPINLSTGRIDGVKVTQTSYFLIQGRSGLNYWNMYSILNISRTSAMQTSANNGASWSDFAGTFDAHLHQYNGTEKFYYYMCANDTAGTQLCEAEHVDPIGYGGLPPTSPNVYAPAAGAYAGFISVNYTAAFSPNGYNITNYTINLSYTNETAFGAISVQYGALSYYWNATDVAYGNYLIKVTACDQYGTCSSGYSDEVTIDNRNLSLIMSTPANETYVTNSQQFNASVRGDFQSYECWYRLDGGTQQFIGNIVNNTNASGSVGVGQGGHNLNVTCLNATRTAEAMNYFTAAYSSVASTAYTAFEFETNNTYFYHVINTTSNVTNINATLHWNGTGYPSTVTQQGLGYYIISNVTLPLITVNNSVASWQLNYTLQGIAVTTNATPSDQNISYAYELISLSAPAVVSESAPMTAQTTVLNYLTGRATAVNNVTYRGSIGVGTLTGAIYNATFTVPALPNETTIMADLTSYYYISFGGRERSYSKTQNVSTVVVWIGNCNATYGTTFLSFYGFDERTILPINYTLNIYVNGFANNVSKNFTGNFSMNVSHHLCMANSTTGWLINSTMDYASLPQYEMRSYFLFDTISTTPGLVNHYLLNTTYASQITFTVVDSANNPRGGVFIYVQRWYPETNSYNMVAMGVSGSDGKAVIRLENIDAWYKILLVQDGGVITEFGKEKLTGTTKTLQINPTSAINFLKYWKTISSNCVSNSTNSVVCTIVDSSGTALKNAELKLQRYGVTAWQTLCDNTGNAVKGAGTASVTLVCAMDTNITGKVYYYSLTMTDDKGYRTVLASDFVGNITESPFGATGLLLTAMLVVTLAAIGAYNPAVSLVLGALGLIISFFMGFVAVSYGSLIGMVIVLIIMALKVKT